jgi:hypothetical protein
MPIIGTLPNNIQNGNTVDATPVMADFNFIVNQVNANANPTGTLTAPSGTRAVFHQAAAPVGWVTDAAITDHTIQVTSVTPGGTNTTGNPYSGMFLSSWTSDGHALTVGELAAHNHGLTDPGHTHPVVDPAHAHLITADATGAPNGAGGVSLNQNPGSNVSGRMATALTGISLTAATTGISVNNAGSGTAHSHTKTFNVNYIQCLVAQKT